MDAASWRNNLEAKAPRPPIVRYWFDDMLLAIMYDDAGHIVHRAVVGWN